jgi:hypothetical protein
MFYNLDSRLRIRIVLSSLMSLGAILMAIYTTAVMALDYEVPTTKLCGHWSNEDLIIMLHHVVRMLALCHLVDLTFQ